MESSIMDGGMNAQAILVVSGAVVILTQMIKWMGLPDKRGPLAVLGTSALGTGLWAWSKNDIARATAFAYFAGWLSVALNSAGVFGFTRSMPEAVSNFTKPPGSGAGSNPTAGILAFLIGALLIQLGLQM